MIILATQKNKMSHPVSRRLVGNNLEKSGCSTFGHPRIDIGHKPEENQVL
jgi:hypothetical protein